MDAVQIVTEKPNAHTEAVVKGFLGIGHAIVIGVAQKPEIGNVRIPNISLPGENASADAIERCVELFGENRRTICFAIAVAIFDELDALAMVGVTVKSVAEMPFHFGKAIIDGAGSQFLIQPI